jgi:hypothetical protein
MGTLARGIVLVHPHDCNRWGQIQNGRSKSGQPISIIGTVAVRYDPLEICR